MAILCFSADSYILYDDARKVLDEQVLDTLSSVEVSRRLLLATCSCLRKSEVVELNSKVTGEVIRLIPWSRKLAETLGSECFVLEHDSTSSGAVADQIPTDITKSIKHEELSLVDVDCSSSTQESMKEESKMPSLSGLNVTEVPKLVVSKLEVKAEQPVVQHEADNKGRSDGDRVNSVDVEFSLADEGFEFNLVIDERDDEEIDEQMNNNSTDINAPCGYRKDTEGSEFVGSLCNNSIPVKTQQHTLETISKPPPTDYESQQIDTPILTQDTKPNQGTLQPDNIHQSTHNSKSIQKAKKWKLRENPVTRLPIHDHSRKTTRKRKHPISARVEYVKKLRDHQPRQQQLGVFARRSQVRNVKLKAIAKVRANKLEKYKTKLRSFSMPEKVIKPKNVAETAVHCAITSNPRVLVKNIGIPPESKSKVRPRTDSEVTVPASINSPPSDVTVGHSCSSNPESV